MKASFLRAFFLLFCNFRAFKAKHVHTKVWVSYDLKMNALILTPISVPKVPGCTVSKSSEAAVCLAHESVVVTPLPKVVQQTV